MSDDKKALTTIQGVTLYGGPTAEEPTVYDLDLARWAGLKSLHDIRRTISKLIERGDLSVGQYVELLEADSNLVAAQIEVGHYNSGHSIFNANPSHLRNRGLLRVCVWSLGDGAHHPWGSL